MANAPTTVTARAPRLVGVILSSAQALLWDEERGEYVIHKVGDDVLGGRLVELDADHVVVERGETREVMEISAPPQMRVAARRQPKRMPALIISAAAESQEKPVAMAPAPAVAAPTASPVAPSVLPPSPLVSTAAAPLAAVPPVEASPTTAGAGPAAPTAPAAAPVPVAATVAAAPVVGLIAQSATPPTTATALPAAQPATSLEPAAPPTATHFGAPPAAQATTPVALPVAPTAPRTPAVANPASPDRKPVTSVLIPRAELDRELGDFAALTQDVQVAAQPDGRFRLAQVRSGSFFERIGLHTNDVLLRVDGRAINGVDDAAAAYAWLRVTNKFTVEVLREGRPMTLRYVVAPPQPLTASAP